MYIIMLNNLHISNNFCTFEGWIGGICKPSDKGVLTAFPHLSSCQQNINKNVSDMLRFEDLPEINSERWLSLEDFEGEEWRDVIGYENVLQISCYGRLKRKERLSYNPHNKSYCRYKEKIIRSQKRCGNYQRFCICVGDNNKVNLSCHRLVMDAFVPNLDNLPFINHKDENPMNNCVYNLEWCTPKYNSNYGTVNERRKQDRIKKGTTVKVVLYDYDGTEIKRYNTAKDAGKDNNVSRTLVVQCCEGNVDSANGLHFRFQNEQYTKRILKHIKNTYYVYKNGKLLFFSTQTKATAKFLNINYCTFRRIVKYNTNYSKLLKDYVIQIRTSTGHTFYIVNGSRKENYGR